MCEGAPMGQTIGALLYIQRRLDATSLRTVVRKLPSPDSQPAGIASDGVEVVEHDVDRYTAWSPSDAHDARKGPNVGTRGRGLRCAEGDAALICGRDDYEMACGVG